jgi:hypothetical protein
MRGIWISYVELTHANMPDGAVRVHGLWMSFTSLHDAAPEPGRTLDELTSTIWQRKVSVTHREVTLVIELTDAHGDMCS